MSHNLTDILHTALSEMKKGSSIEEVVSKHPELKAELEPMLKTAQQLMEIPVSPVPEPVMRRRFLYEPVKERVWSSWLHVSRFAAASTAVLLLIASGTATAYGAIKSLPGQPLFQLKKAAEQVHVSMVSNPVDKANLQLALSQKRLDETQQVLNNPSKTPEQESAALTELSSQTKETIASVKTAAATSPITQKDHPVIASLEDLAKQQQKIIDQVSGQNNIKSATDGAIASTQEVKTFLQVVAASSDPAVVTTLSPDPNTVTISGTISDLDKEKITVEKTSFQIDEKTAVKDADGNAIDVSKLRKEDKVHIVGNKNKEVLVASEVKVLKDITSASQPEVKSASTTASSTLPIVIKKVESRRPATTTDPTADESQTNQTPKAVGTFIPEDPSPQYVPGVNGE